MPLPRKLVDEVQAAAKRPENVAMYEKMNEILTGDKTSSFTLGDFTGKTGLNPGDLVTDARNNTVIIKGVPAHTPAEVESALKPHIAAHGGGGGDQPRVPAGSSEGGEWTKA